MGCVSHPVGRHARRPAVQAGLGDRGRARRGGAARRAAARSRGRAARSQRPHPLRALPARQRLEHARRHATGRSQLRRLHRPHRRRDGPARRLRHRLERGAERHPLRRRLRHAAQGARRRSTTPTRATRAPIRSRPTRPSRAGRTRPATATSSCSTPTTCSSTSSSRRTPTARAGRRARAQSSTCGRTRCAPTAGRRPTPPACRSSPASCATTRRCRRGSSTTPCASRSRRRSAPTSTRRRTTRAAAPTPTCRRWACASVCKASFDISGFPACDRVILQALKTYGMIVADNGSSWYISGAPDAGWDDDALHALGQVKGGDFRGRRHERPVAAWCADGRRHRRRDGARGRDLRGDGLVRGRDGGRHRLDRQRRLRRGRGTQALVLAPDKTFVLSHLYRRAGRRVVTVQIVGDNRRARNGALHRHGHQPGAEGPRGRERLRALGRDLHAAGLLRRPGRRVIQSVGHLGRRLRQALPWP